MKKLLLCLFLLPGAALLFAQQNQFDGAGEPALEMEGDQGSSVPDIVPLAPPAPPPAPPAPPASPAAPPVAAPSATVIENPQPREGAAAARPASEPSAGQEREKAADVPPPPEYAQSPSEDGEFPESDAASLGEEEISAYEEAPVPKKEGFRFKNRRVELVINAKVDVANNGVAATDILQEVAEVNLDNFLGGFKVDVGAFIDPFLLKFNWKDRWGFGLGVNVTAAGNMDISGNVLTLQPSTNDTIGMGAAAFADFAIPVFFHVGDFKVKFRPAAFLPVAYMEPGISYTRRRTSHVASNGETLTGELVAIDYDMYVYTPVSLAGIDDGSLNIDAAMLQNFDFTSLGYDFGLGVEYPLYDLLDVWLNVGVDISNFPLVFASLNHYMLLQGRAWLDTSYIDIADILGGNDLDENAFGFPEEFKPLYGEKTMRVYRPFKMLFYADYRPFDSPILSLIPSLGFSINPLYVQKGSIEGGVSARCDLANILITTIGINYIDRKWRNSLDLAINLRAFELDIGIGSQSQDFLKSWQGAGVFVNLGIKLGW